MLKEVKSSGVRKDSGTYFDFSSFFSLTLTFPFTTFLQLSNKVKAKKEEPPPRQVYSPSKTLNKYEL